MQGKALYSYEGTTAEELPFAEGDILTIVDREDESWWKAVNDGVVFLVPASYLEISGKPLLPAPHRSSSAKRFVYAFFFPPSCNRRLKPSLVCFLYLSAPLHDLLLSQTERLQVTRCPLAISASPLPLRPRLSPSLRSHRISPSLSLRPQLRSRSP